MKFEKIFANHYQRLISKIYKRICIYQTTQYQKKKITEFQNEQRPWIGISQKKTYIGPTCIWKGAHHHSSSEKWKSKPPWDITSHLLEWLLSKRKKITSVSKDVGKREPLHTKWEFVQPLRKTSWRSLNKLKIELPDLPGGTVVKNPPANAADTGSNPGPGRSHMPQSN